MSQRFFGALAIWCFRWSAPIIMATALLVTGSAYYIARHFAINTNVSNLISPQLPWRRRELAYESEFPQQANSILVVVSAPTPELVGAATEKLAGALSQDHSLFRSVQEEGSGKFFARNDLLYESTGQLASEMQRLRDAAPLVKVMAADPSLRGLAHALSFTIGGMRADPHSLASAASRLNMVADALDAIEHGRPATFSWRTLVTGAAPEPQDLRRFIEVWPMLDYRALEPGKAATDAIRNAASELALESDFSASVRLTGPVPIADQEFASLRQGVWYNAAATAGIILVVLWLALRSLRIVSAVVVTVSIGLVLTAALGLLFVGSFNPISIAFAFLFVGLGADFAIQFAVRYRAERHDRGGLRGSIARAANYTGKRLLLAAAAAATGFLSFMPTQYRGVAELGQIAGLGMAVGYVTCMTLLPVFLDLFKPPTEPRPLGFAAMAPVDRFFQRHRIAIVFATAAIVVLGLPSLLWLRFDFNPLRLRNSNSEAVATMQQLSNDSGFNTYAAEVLVPAVDVASVAAKLSHLPEVKDARDLRSLVPDDQQRKRQLVASAAAALEPALRTIGSTNASDRENVEALKSAARSLEDVADETAGPGSEAATRLSRNLNRLADGDVRERRKAETTFVQPLLFDLTELRQSLHPQVVTRADLPGPLVRDWTAPDGRLRIEVTPKGNANNSATLVRFAQAVLSAQPNATGPAIETYEWGSTILAAFIKAAAWALGGIALLLWLALRRIGDVLLTLIPLLVAAAATLEICALSGFALNYANIIALPALLGIGVAFKIYYVMEWRAGETNFLQSVLTRAVFFSAVMTATAFGSLCFSNQPGISSMGKLLALSLACTLASAALFQPALMGPPREIKHSADSKSRSS
jgi:uncharacterized protein